MNKQQLITKYAKMFAEPPGKIESILQGVYYRSDGTVIIANRRYALRIRNAHELPQPIVLHAKTGQPLSGTYPDIDKAFPTSFDNEISINRDMMADVLLRVRCATDIALRFDKRNPVIALTIEKWSAYLRIQDDDHFLKFSAFFGNTQNVETSNRLLNAEHLHTALSVFADAESDKVVVKLRGPNEPVVLTDEKDIDVITMPYRTAS